MWINLHYIPLDIWTASETDAHTVFLKKKKRKSFLLKVTFILGLLSSLSIHSFTVFYASLMGLSVSSFLQLPVYTLYTFFPIVSNISFQSLTSLLMPTCPLPSQNGISFEKTPHRPKLPLFVLRLLSIYDFILSNLLFLISILTF